MRRLLIPALLIAAFLAGGVSPVRADLGSAAVSDVTKWLERISDSLKEIARHSDREVRVVCECKP